MTGTIKRCSAWREEHDRPRYTLGDTCPDCGQPAFVAAPARFSPDDPYGEYRRALRSTGSDPA